MATIEDFECLDIRVGTVVGAEPHTQARKPSIKLTIDFGPELGIRRSSAQITVHYTLESLLGRQVVAVVNLPLRRIATFESQVLTLGLPDKDNFVVLLAPDQAVPNGGRLF